jgi:hypothetical protein
MSSISDQNFSSIDDDHKEISLSKEIDFKIETETHYNKKGAYCDPNILANNKEIRFRKPAVPNKNFLQTLKPLRNPHIRTRTIATPETKPIATHFRS